jgi:hypothetical protein
MYDMYPEWGPTWRESDASRQLDHGSDPAPDGAERGDGATERPDDS